MFTVFLDKDEAPLFIGRRPGGRVEHLICQHIIHHGRGVFSIS